MDVVGEHIPVTQGTGHRFRSVRRSGVVAIEAARHKRRAIVCDLNPIASRITELTLRQVSLTDLRAPTTRGGMRAQRIEALYECIA